jgi:flavin-dependent thymidylate synthase
MAVKLLNESYIREQFYIAIRTARICYDSEMKSSSSTDIDEADVQLLHNLLKAGHGTIFEQIDLVLEIDDVSRALICQASRHRIQSLGVQSTRYTLDKMLKEYEVEIKKNNEISQKSVDKYFYTFPYSKEIVNFIVKKILENGWVFNKKTNDILKYCFPEALKTKFITKINLRSFLNMYILRTDEHALLEFQELMRDTFDILPKYIQDLISLQVSLKK